MTPIPCNNNISTARIAGDHTEEGRGPGGGPVQHAPEQPALPERAEVAGIDVEQRDDGGLQLVHRAAGGQRSRQRKRSVD